MGQGARLISDGDLVIDLIFYRSMQLLGEGIYWIVFIFSILATIIASQGALSGHPLYVHTFGLKMSLFLALVTATFSLYQQVSLGLLEA